MHKNGGYPQNFIRFLGTAGTRFIMLSQRRSSGGMWFSYGDVNGVIDPGPGSLVQICKAKPPLFPEKIDGIILTHRHIDHSNDLNVLSEAMTLKAREKKGGVLLTGDSMKEGDCVLLQYVRRKIAQIWLHMDGQKTSLSRDVCVESVMHTHHGVECYGLVFRSRGLPSWGVISDTAALPHFPARYRDCELVVINCTLPLPWTRLDHISVSDVESLLQVLSPKLVILTHMGRHILDIGPRNIARSLSTKRTTVIAAEDGMIIDLAKMQQQTLTGREERYDEHTRANRCPGISQKIEGKNSNLSDAEHSKRTGTRRCIHTG